MDAEGDPRVHFLLNLALSAAFAGVALRGLDAVGALAFTWPGFLLGTLALMALTYLVT